VEVAVEMGGMKGLVLTFKYDRFGLS
jgi:hypothetical protein